MIGLHTRPYLDADRVADTAQILDMRVFQAGSPHAKPGKMRGQVEPTVLAWHLPGQGLFIVQVQGFVGGVEINPPEVACALPGYGFHKTHRAADTLGQALELRR